MLPSQIRGNLWPVAAQILDYAFQPIPKGQQTKGQSQALQSGAGWIQSILNEPFRPSKPPDELIHAGNGNSCDAIQHRYQVPIDSGDLSFQISQTVFVIAVVVTPSTPPSGQDPQRVAVEVARRLFVHPEKLNFQTTEELGWIALGRQVPPENSAGSDWLDTLHWWTDGTNVGFFLLKKTGPGQSSKPSGSLEANRSWFLMFERRRTR